MQTGIKSIRYELLIFLVILACKGCFNFLFPGLTMTGGTDEFVTISGAAMTSGYDWSALVSRTLFYGFGYTTLMAPLFSLGLSSSAIYVGMLFYNAVCLALCGVICYRILTKIFGLKNTLINVLIALTAGLFAPNLMETNFILNEGMLILLNWLALYLLLIMLKRAERGEKNTIHSILLSFVMCYGLLVHTRIMFIWGAIAVYVVLYSLINKKSLLNLLAFIPSFIIFFICARLLISYVQSILWRGADGVLNNSVESLGQNFVWLAGAFSYSGMAAAFRNLAGQLYSVFVFTGGFAFILFAVFIVAIICFIIPKTRKRFLGFVRENKTLTLAFAYMAALLIAVILFVSAGSIPHTNWDFGFINTKWFLYTRYWAVCAAPAAMLVIVLFDRLRKTRLIIVLAGILAIAVNAAFFYKVAPLFFGVENTRSSVFYQYHGLAFMQIGDELTIPVFQTITLVAGIITALIYLCLLKRKYAVALTVFLVFSMYTFIYPTVGIYSDNSQRMNAQFSGVAEVFKNEKITPERYPVIYAYGLEVPLMNAQFNFYRFKIVPVDTAENRDEYPVFLYVPDDGSEIQVFINDQV